MLTTLRLEIDRLLRAGLAFDEVERLLIDTAPVDEERRAALWLYGWVRAGSRPRTAAVPLAA